VNVALQSQFKSNVNDRSKDLVVLDRICLPVTQFEVESLSNSRFYESLFPIEHLLPPQDADGDAVISRLLDFADEIKIRKGRTAPPREIYEQPRILEWRKEADKLDPAQQELNTKRSRQFFGAMKAILTELIGGGRRGWHNFTTLRASPGESTTRRRMGRFFHCGIIVVNGVILSKLRLNGDLLLHGQARCMFGLALGIGRGWIPPEFIYAAVDDNTIMDIPPIPAWLSYLHECKFEFWENKYRMVLDPRRKDRISRMEKPKSGESLDLMTNLMKITRTFETRDKMIQSAVRVENWETEIHGHIAKLVSATANMTWLKDFEITCRTMVSSYYIHNALLRRELELASSTQIQTEIEAKTQFHSLPQVPSEYERVLQLLRDADNSGLWPASTEARKKVIFDADNESFTGGTFSVGVMPEMYNDPRGNTLFPELLRAAFQLEKVIAPNRPPSATIAINRHASFKPHRDTGAGAGQTVSLIVALGDFVGGEIVVEGQPHDIRYKPIEFNGWKQRHWTLPFKGERYSLVYFTPLGTDEKRMFWNFEKEQGVLEE
jgi:tRNA U38,U39,U40 pseudouridine synthase TruA